MEKKLIIKRTFDLFFALFLIIALSPLFILIIILLLINQGKPVFFRHQRPGLNEKIFTLYKFRTMKERDGSNEERLTKIGRLLRKFSIDEWLQLWNILKGDMSFVGPRPLLKEYIQIYTPEESKRHKVKPGITGWAQIHGRNELSFKDRFKLDIWYVENFSLWLDLKIIFLTVPKVLRRKSIGTDGKTTIPLFDPEKHEHPDDTIKL